MFDILKPPKGVSIAVGTSGGVVDIPIVQRKAGGGGGTVPAVKLDTVLGNVTAAIVFPANDATDMAFRKAPATRVEARTSLTTQPNFNRVRWIRPEHIKVLSR